MLYNIFLKKKMKEIKQKIKKKKRKSIIKTLQRKRNY